MKSWWIGLFLLAACGDAATGPDEPDGGDTQVLAPGAAGTGHLAYLVRDSSTRTLEVVNLTTGQVEYRSTEDDGEVASFFLSADGSTAVYHTASNPCTRVSLPSGATSDCAPAGTAVAYPVGISSDGSRIAFTAIRSDTFQPTRVIVEDATVTFLDDAPADSGSQSIGSGAISPDGESFYELRYANEPTNPRLALWKYTIDGSAAPEAIFDFTAGVQAHNIVDLVLELSEDGTRGLFPCADPTEVVPAERISVCTIELSTATVVRYPNAIGSLALDGSAIVTVPFIGENYSVYPFGSTTPSATIVQPGGLATLSPDATRMGFRLRADDAFYVAATILVSGGEPVRVQGMRPTARATPEYLLWRR